MNEFERLGYDVVDIHESDFFQTSSSQATKTFWVALKKTDFSTIKLPSKDEIEFGELEMLDSEKVK